MTSNQRRAILWMTLCAYNGIIPMKPRRSAGCNPRRMESLLKQWEAPTLATHAYLFIQAYPLFWAGIITRGNGATNLCRAHANRILRPYTRPMIGSLPRRLLVVIKSVIFMSG